MKLRNGTPPWLRPAPAALHRHRQRHDRQYDVAVIGAGITGALVSHELLAAGLSVVTLDKREASLGSTAASTGLLLYQPDASMAEISRRHSRRAAERVYQLGRNAIRELGRLIRTLHLDCEWRTRHSVYFASRARDVRPLRQEAANMRRIGFPVHVLKKEDVRRRYGVRLPAALVAPGGAEVNALKLTRGIFAHCLRHPDFELRQRTRVRSLREDKHGVELATEAGKLRARWVVVATGYECDRFDRSKLARMQATYVIASPRLPPKTLAPVRHLMWETARPYFYLRTTADHRIVFGGLDDAYATPGRHRRKLPAKTRALEAAFAALFPTLAFRAEYAWTAAFADTRDGLPLIGPAKAESRVLYALGYGGNGITFSQIAAQILRDACLNRANSDAHIFAVDRGRKRSGG